MTTYPNLINKRTFNTQQLVTNFPPYFSHSHKKLIYDIACPPGCAHKGDITFSRWQSFPLPKTIAFKKESTRFEIREDIFNYKPNNDDSVTEWYLNFAHSRLFIAYGGPLFAQDEMQLAEHPALGSLREALLELDMKPLTVEKGQPTPILVKGVERRCKIATDPNPAQLRPEGLYGYRFARADEEAIKLATTPINPPTITNLIAMKAPSDGEGVYTKDEIDYVLRTAFTGFSAAKREATITETKTNSTTVHTGFWGCGAYGGNRILMSLLQLLAATMAEVEQVIFYAFDASGVRAFEQAKDILENKLLALTKVDAIIDEIDKMSFRWGVGDGN